MKEILIAADHAGFELKETLMVYLRDLGYEVKDFGAFEFNAEDDYPDFIMPLAREVSESGGIKQGIIIGGSGQGEAIAANRFPHVRAMVFCGEYDPPSVKKIPLRVKTAREHNDTNIISLGARFITEDDAKEAIKTFLTTPFSEDERHIRRIQKIEENI